MASQRIQRRKTTIDVPDVAVTIFALRQAEVAAQLAQKAGASISVSVSVTRALYDQLATVPGAEVQHKPRTPERDYELWRVKLDGDLFLCWEPPVATTTTTATASLPEIAQPSDAKEAA